MKKILFLFSVFSIVFTYASEVSGIVLLENSSDHSGVIIKFTPSTSSAVYNETTSDQSGFYSAVVENGVYDISFEKAGYQTFTLENQIISSDITLQDITLDASPIVYVSGDTSGTWSPENTYIVIDNATVPENETLIIEPGVVIKFDGYYSFTINGTLTAIGNDSSQIVFTSNRTEPNDNDWRGILINNENTLSELSFCIIEYGNNNDDDLHGLVEIKGHLNISHSIIRHSRGNAIRGVQYGEGDVTIQHSEIYDCESGIKMSGMGEIISENNYVHDFNFIGIRYWMDTASGSIKGNKVGNGPIALAIWTGIPIERNIVFNAGIGLDLGDGDPIVFNNTFFNLTNSIRINSDTYWNAHGQINSNIFYNNSDYVIVNSDERMPSSLEYNLFFDNDEDISQNLPTAAGIILTTNANGTDADTYYNIFEDPEFLSLDPNNLDFCRLSENSHAINAGDPNINNPFDSTIVDIGAVEGFGTLSISDEVVNRIKIFPNPVVDNFTIQSDDFILFNEFIIYNTLGQKVKKYQLNDTSVSHSFRIEQNLKSGLYFLEVINDHKKLQRVKFLKL